MSIEPGIGVSWSLRHDLQALRGEWGWFLALGILLIVLGTFAMSWAALATFAVVLTYGVILVIAGIAQAVGAFWARQWSGFFLHLLEGVLYLVLGMLFLRVPVQAALAVTLLLACFLMVGGLFKIVASLTSRFPNWGWALASGVIDLLLGVMIWLEWPWSGLVVIGIFLGIQMIFHGWFWVMLALGVRKILRATPTSAAF